MFSPAVRSLVRFQLATGLAPASRSALTPVLLLAVVLLTSPDPGAVLVSLADAASRWNPGVVLGVFAVVLVTSRTALRPFREASGGWARSLGISRRDRSVACRLALATCQAPTVLLVLVAWGAGPTRSPAMLAGLLLGAIAAIGLAVATERGVTGARSVWTRLRDARRGRRPAPRVDTLLPLRILAGRTSGALAGGVAWCLPALGAIGLWIRNNDLSPEDAGVGIRVGGAAAVVAAQLTLASALRRRRPPWAWARSLPTSAAARVRLDAAVLLGIAVPALAGVAAFDPRQVPALLVGAAFCAVRWTGAVRRESRSPTALEPGAIWEAVLLLLGLVAFPVLALGLLATIVPAFGRAVEVERRTKASRWTRRYHREQWA